MTFELPIATICSHPPTPSRHDAIALGASREGRTIWGWQLGEGPLHVSLLGGCHADEPVGPETLRRLVSWLQASPTEGISWWIVPHTNPDGEARNVHWWDRPGQDPQGRRIVDLALYSAHAVRELPGDDVEFGFPCDDPGAEDAGAPPEIRPENRAIASFLAQGAPFHLHASLHGMAFAAGPWFLLESTWENRTLNLRDTLRARVAEMGYTVHDVDRGGDKGFRRIDEGFTTRPDSVAMRRHFLDRDDQEMARRFRPSSMEWVRAQGGDPLTLVSEMPLFVGPRELWQGEDPVRPPEITHLRTLRDPTELRIHAERLGIRGLPIEDQTRLQLEYIAAGLKTAVQHRT